MGKKCRQLLWSMQGMLFTALVGLFFVLPGMVSNVCAADATISEEKPGTIPSDIIADWKAQDGTNYASVISAMKTKYPKYADKFTGSTETDYLNACHWRRVARLKDYTEDLLKLLYARHHDVGGMIMGYTEDLNSEGKGFGPWGMSASKSSNYSSGNSGGTAIHLLEFKDYYPKPSDVITDSKGCLRDPCPTYDGQKVVFAWSKDNNGYSIFDIDVATKTTRQLTDDPEGIKVSDYEPCVTPIGDIIFMSSRCFQHVDCNINLVSNLFIMNKDGKYLRRIGYDQVNVFGPTMREDGSVMYTRWEYNDKNVANVMGIFTMMPDGCHQNEFYGNQTSNPAMFMQAASVPGNPQLAIAVLGGHMGPHAGDICLVDASKVRNGTSGVTMICPKGRSLGSGGAYNMDGVDDKLKLFQNPYPLDATCMLVSYRKTRTSRFQIFWMDFDGNRELIASGGSQSVSQPISLKKRPIPIMPNYQVDYRDSVGVVSVVDVNYAQGNIMKNVTKGQVKKIRVCAMEYRTDPAHGNTGSSAYQMGPVGRYGCSWEAKWICGEADVAEDGSACFTVPARTPVFLQLIDEKGVMIQTQRSWMTLQPGERFDCMGCHEDKNAAPLSKSMKNVDPVPLKPFYNLPQKPGNFSFLSVVQPILDANCVKSGCHETQAPVLKENIVDASTLGNDEKNAYRSWSKSYYNLSDKKYCSYNCIFGGAEAISARSIGSPKSKVITQLVAGHKSVSLSKEDLEKLAAWIDLGVPHSGSYYEDMPDNVLTSYKQRMKRRETQEAIEAKNIAEFIKDGQYDGVNGVNQPEVTKKVVSMNGVKVRFLATDRMLSLDLPSEGKIKLLDLMGRQILSRDVTRDAFLENAQQNIKLSIPAGTYIVKFKGVKVNSEQIVSVL